MVNRTVKIQDKLFIRVIAFGMAAGIMFVGNGMSAQAAPKRMEDGTTFDAEYYAGRYPDVVAVYGTEEAALYQHYVDYGRAENREAVAVPSKSTFDAKFYAERYPDVVAVCGTGVNNLYQHYLQYGKNEGRRPTASSTVKSEEAPVTSSSDEVKEAAKVETPVETPVDTSMQIDEARLIVSNFYMNMVSYFNEDILAFFDKNGDYKIDDTEVNNLWAWAIEKYNVSPHDEEFSDAERIAFATDYKNGNLKLPDTLYVP